MSGLSAPRRGFSIPWVAATLVVVVCLVGILAYFKGSFKAQPSETRPSAAPLRIRQVEYAPVHGPRFARANVVVISIDTLRRDHIAPYGAPFETIAASRLAREGALFDHAVSQVPLTMPSHTSLFTGLYPPHHGVRDNGGFVLGMSATTLAERFLANGYSTAGFVSSYVLDSRWGIAQGHETYDDSLDYKGLERRSLTDVERPAAAVVDAALGWLRQPTRGERPFYLWVHLYDPHEPYVPPDEYRRRAPTAYAGEVIYADAQVARLLEALDALNLRGNTVIVYLSDHGESLGEHGEPTHGIFLYGSTLDVPLIIAPPTGRPTGLPALTLAGRRVRGLARNVDITPTLLDLTELPVPPGLDGVSLLPMVAHEVSVGAGSPPGSEASREKGGDISDAIVGPLSYAESHFPRLHYGWSELVALETERWKFVRAPRPELYDLQEDPTELHDVSSRYPRVAATLKAQLDTMKLLETNDEPTSAKIDADALARLRSLGYISGRESSASRRKGPRPDPKDQMPLLQELLQAQALGDAGQLDDAARRLEALARRDSDNPAVHLALSSVYLARKDAQAAVVSARHAVDLDPDSAVAVLNLAFAYQAAGRGDAAASGFERVLALDPDNLKALVSLAEVHYGRGEREEALDLYQRAAAIAPGFAPVQVSLGGLALELNRRQVAEAALKRAAALGGTPPGLHFNLGVLAEQRGNAAAAAREYRAEVTAYPESLEAWVNLGLLERQAGNLDAAVAAFEHAATAKTDAFVGPYLLAETLFRLGRGADAERWAREALHRNPNEPRVHQLLQRIQNAAARK